MNHFIRS